MNESLLRCRRRPSWSCDRVTPRAPTPSRCDSGVPAGQPPASGHHPGAGECGDPATVRGGLLGPPPPPQAESGGGGGGETRGRGQLAAPSVLRLTSSPCPDPGAWTLSPGQSHRWVGAWRGAGGGTGGGRSGDILGIRAYQGCLPFGLSTDPLASALRSSRRGGGGRGVAVPWELPKSPTSPPPPSLRLGSGKLSSISLGREDGGEVMRSE